MNQTHPIKVGVVANVGAHIVYYGSDLPDVEVGRVHFPCWLNEESPYVTLHIGKPHYLILGTLQHESARGRDPRFTIYEHDLDSSKPLSQSVFSNYGMLRIIVRLIAGKSGEFSRNLEFEFKPDGDSYTFEYVTDERKREIADGFLTNTKELLGEGERLFSEAVTADDWERFYLEICDWRTKTDSLMLKHNGLTALQRFRNTGEMKSYPYPVLEENRRSVDEFYTQFLNLREIAEELSHSSIVKRRERIRKPVAAQTEKAESIKRLSAFAEEGDLLLSRGTGMKSDWPKAKDWAARAESYIRENVGEDSAAWFSLATTEGWPGIAIDRRYVDWIYTRIQRLGQLAAEVRKR